MPYTVPFALTVPEMRQSVQPDIPYKAKPSFSVKLPVKEQSVHSLIKYLLHARLSSSPPVFISLTFISALQLSHLSKRVNAISFFELSDMSLVVSQFLQRLKTVTVGRYHSSKVHFKSPLFMQLSQPISIAAFTFFVVRLPLLTQSVQSDIIDA